LTPVFPKYPLAGHQPRPDTKLTPELITSLWRPVEVRLAPDGHRAAWTAKRWGADGERDESAVWVADIGSDETGRRWTFGCDDAVPRWSPDGTRLALLSGRKRPGIACLYLMEAAGGEARPLVERGRSVHAFSWSPDGERIAFLAPDEPSAEDRRREEEKDDARPFGDWHPNRVWTVEVVSGTVKAAPEVEGHPIAIDWSPDGTALALVVQPTPELDSSLLATVVLLGVDPGTSSVTVCRSPGADDLRYNGTGERLVFTAFHEPDPVSALTVWAVAPHARAEPTVIGPQVSEAACGVGVCAVAGERRVVLQVVEGLGTRLEWCDPITGERERWWDASGDITSLDVAPSHELAVACFVERGPLEVWAGEPPGLRRLSDHHAAIREIPLGSVRDFGFPSEDGSARDGMVVLPPGAGPTDGPWPTVVIPHGGPYGHSGRQLYLSPGDWAQWLATDGYAVLMPNYSGSIGHGQAFAASVRGKVGGEEWRDVLAAVEAAIEAGISDPERLGIGGWSQGGFLSAWAVTQTNRFRAAIVGAGVTDWSILALTSDSPAFEGGLAGGSPWDAEDRRRADARSPIVGAARVRTPTLILHGECDERIPLYQARAFHLALRRHDVPVELVIYPREPHGLRERHHQEDVMRRVRAWYARWLKASV
jgi:dienelactone hydrolase